jgi:hypothetical protein
METCLILVALSALFVGMICGVTGTILIMSVLQAAGGDSSDPFDL